MRTRGGLGTNHAANVCLCTDIATSSSGSRRGILDCAKKDADPIYCREGKPRPICVQDNILVFADTRLPMLGF